MATFSAIYGTLLRLQQCLAQVATWGYLEKHQRDGGLGEGNRNACIVSR